ncbi:hypothetical protein GCM10009000_029510 [Halobacterium noricense]
MGDMSEAAIHFDLYHHLQNAIEDGPRRGNRTYGTVSPEFGDGIDGFADLIVFDDDDEPVLTIEAKKPEGSNKREIDPYSPKVIKQAFSYAAQIGSRYFATFNGDRFVLFNTFEEGAQLLERSTKSYEISSLEKFADSILDEIARLEEGEAKWDSLDDAFIERVRSLHEQITPPMQSSLSDHLEESEDFRSDFIEWVEAQGFEYDEMDDDEREEVQENFAEQAAYLIVNKIIFYRILEDSNAYADDVKPLAVSIHRVQEDLEDYFTDVVENVDFEAIFEHDEVFSEIPLDPVAGRIRDFIIELDDQDLTQFDSDVIGRIYEGVIPAERRHDMGEYYTPPAICDLITRLTIRDANADVLDPACGSGGFPVSAYHRKREMLAKPQGSHTRILDDLYGIDINRFPAHLSAINLAIQDLSSHTENVQIRVKDFFKVLPATEEYEGEVGDASGESSEEYIMTPDDMDAVVGNPPYIRHESIDDKERVRWHLPYVDADHISSKADIYAYFVTHATEFLRDGGRLGFITSDRWLDTSYGEDLQEFILDNYEIKAVIKFDKQAFEDALIGSTVLIIEKQPTQSERDNNTTKFLRVKQSLDIDDIVEIVEDDYEAEQIIRTDEYRLVTRTQEDLYSEDKWNLFFIAPPVYFEALGETDTELSDVADLSYGKKTGANPFFCRKTEDVEDLGIEEYTTPLLKASGQITQIDFDGPISEEWRMVDLHDLVEEAQSDIGQRFASGDDESVMTTDKEARVKDWLKDNGHETLVEYIGWGEDQGYHERASMKSRDIWFDLGDLPYPPIFVPEFTWRTFRASWAADSDGVCTNKFYNVQPKAGVDAKLLCAILNTRLMHLNAELGGRWTGGQGMDRIDLMLYEARDLPLLDPREIDEDDREDIIEAFDELIEGEKRHGPDPEASDVEEERDELDRAVLSAMGLEDKVEDVKQAVELMITMREKGAGQHTEVLVDRAEEEREVIDIAGVSEARESTTLSDF